MKPFKAYAPGGMHSEVKYLPALAGEPRRFLFVAMDRATRWVVIALKKDRTAPSAQAFLTALVQAAPFRAEKQRSAA